MYKILLILLLLIYNLNVKATECVERTFKEEYLNLYLCQNYSNYNETRTLLFKERAKILNEYIHKQIKLENLQNKKVEIQLYDSCLSFQYLEISKGKNGYFVSFSGFATTQQLKTFIDYFILKNWKPIFTNAQNNESTSKQIDDFFIKNKTSELVLKQETVWSLNDLKLNYVNDKLKYSINNVFLDIIPSSSLPVKIKDRFILFQSDSIFVLQGPKIIKKLKTDYLAEDYSVYSYKNWVNICNGGQENWVYSYSYKKNNFYKKPTKNE